MSDHQALRLHTRTGRRSRARWRRGFSLIDLLVSMAVVAVLILIMVPSLSTVRESARRVVCSSNIRQIGLGLGIYADDYKGAFPVSKFVDQASLVNGSERIASNQYMMTVRTYDAPDAWDGLGILYVMGYLDAPGVFYCPSHHGVHHFSRYAPYWAGQDGPIVANYHYRGQNNVSDPRQGTAMVADGMASRSDFNHRVGANVLHSDLTVSWFSDVGGVVASLLPAAEDDPLAGQKVGNAWEQMDQNNGR